MNKREMIHVLIDKLLDIEESSQKGVNFSYSSNLGMDFHFTSRPYMHGDWICGRHDFWTNSNCIKENFDKALTKIEAVKNTPDTEPKVMVELTHEKAKNLGLIDF